jgi:hypothetical protein
VLLGYKHGTAYHLSETNVRDFAGDVKMQGAARGILVTLGVAEPNAPGLAKRYGIELVDGAALWPKVREFLPANIRDHVRLQTAAQTWKTIWIGTAGSLALGVAVFFVANNLASDENLNPLATAATTSRAAASDATSSAALKKINATAAAMKQVATLTDAELVQRRADALKQITSNAQVGSAGWSSESTLLITLRQSDGADAGLIENVCGILSGYEELHFTRLQLQPPVSSTMPVRWRQCK